MPLQSQFIEMPLIKGLDTKTDPKQVPLGKLLEAENVVYNRPGRIEKRNGFSNLPQTIIDTGNNMDVGRAVDNYKEELIAFDTGNFYSYVEGTDKWKDKGDFVSAYLTASPITNGTNTDSEQDTAYHSSGIACYVYKSAPPSGTTKLFYTIVDTTNGQIILTKEISANASHPKVVTYQNSFIIYYINTSNNRLYYGVLAVGNINATVSYSPITGVGSSVDDLDPTPFRYDVEVITTNALGEGIYLIFRNNAATDFRQTLRRYSSPTDPSPVQVELDTLAPAPYGQAEPRNFCLTYERRYDAIFVASCMDATLDYRIISAGLDDGSGNPDIILSLQVDLVSAAGDQITAVSNSSTELDIGVFVTIDFQTTFTRITEAAGVMVNTFSGKVAWLTALVSKCIKYGDNNYAIISGAPSNQITYFLVDNNLKPIARFAQQLGISAELDAFLTSFTFINETETLFAIREKTSAIEISGVQTTNVRGYNLNLSNPEKSYASDELADNLYVGGGMLFAYDGVSLVEDNFNYYPSGSASPVSGSGPFSYAYRFTYEWVDNWGNVHVSTPSDDVRVTIATPIGVSGSVVNLTCSAMNLTEKDPALGRNPILIRAYRTVAGSGDLYYQLPATSANTNNLSSLSITLPVDNITDANLVSGAPLYTNGDVLEAQPSPPVGALVSHKNRLFVLDSTNPLTIYYSNEYSEDTPPAFNFAATIQVDPFGGPVTGLASMDDKLIIFKENSIRYLVGQGPNNTGADNDYQGTTLITSDCGCSNTRSIVNTPDGLMFKSNKGIMLLNRGLQVGYIGNAVEKYNSANVTSAVLTTKLNQVRLTLDTGITLVYDYFIDVWSVFTNINAVDSVIWNNQHTYIRSNGQVLQETEGSYVDGSSAIPMKISTTWLQLSGIQGFQRLFRFYILGSWKSSHQLKVQLSYDYNDAYSQEIIVNPVPLSTYGTGNYGSESPYGGEFALYQYQINPARQKCMCMKVVISDIPSGSVALGASCDISNLRFEYGVEGKGNRLRDANIAG